MGAGVSSRMRTRASPTEMQISRTLAFFAARIIRDNSACVMLALRRDIVGEPHLAKQKAAHTFALPKLSDF